MADNYSKNKILSEDQKASVIDKLQNDIENMKAKYLVKASKKDPLVERLENSGVKKTYTTLSSNNTNLEQKFQKIINHDLPENNNDYNYNEIRHQMNDEYVENNQKSQKTLQRNQIDDDLDVEKDNLSDFDMNEYADEDQMTNNKNKNKGIIPIDTSNSLHFSKNLNEGNGNLQSYKFGIPIQNQQSFDPKLYVNNNYNNYKNMEEGNNDGNVRGNNIYNKNQMQSYEMEENMEMDYNQEQPHYEMEEEVHNHSGNQNIDKNHSRYNEERQQHKNNSNQSNRNNNYVDQEDFQNPYEGMEGMEGVEMDQEMNPEMDDNNYNYNNNINYNNNYNNNQYNPNNKDKDEESDIENMQNEYLNANKAPTNYKPTQTKNLSETLKNKNNNKDKGDYSIFDKAKEDLLRVRQEIDDMDQYDYKNFAHNQLTESKREQQVTIKNMHPQSE